MARQTTTGIRPILGLGPSPTMIGLSGKDLLPPEDGERSTITPRSDIDRDTLNIIRSYRLVNAFCNLTLNQYRILMAMVSVINPLGEYKSDLRVQLTPHQISDITGINIDNLRRRKKGTSFIESAGEALQKTLIKSYNADNGRIERIPVATYSGVDVKNGTFFLDLHRHMIRELTNLAKTRYIKESTAQMMELSSVRNWVIAGLIRAELHTKRTDWQTVDLKVHMMRFACGVEDEEGNLLISSISDHSKFKSRILTPALEEIDRHTDLEILKEGDKFALQEFTAFGSRRVASITIRVRIRPAALPKSGTPALREPFLQLLHEIGVTGEPLERLLKQIEDGKQDRERVARNAEWMAAQLRDGRKPFAHPHNMLVNFACAHDMARIPMVVQPFNNPTNRRNQALREILLQVVVRVWWTLSDRERGAIEEIGVSINADGIYLGNLVKEYQSLLKEEPKNAAQMLSSACSNDESRLQLLRGEASILSYADYLI